ncbi:unnamed protein product [Lasius platythorax]|uniref:Uncharacterized protein n=1 Tax=Lasius platythorax TaxID=488582 RepID=A0AAV2PAC6_9HYME
MTTGRDWDGGRGTGCSLTMDQQERLDLFTARRAPAETGSYAIVYCTHIGRPHPEGRYSNLGNFQIGRVHHHKLTVNAG